jgi:hypothetical protein
MAENHSSTRAPITRKPHRCQADEDLAARFICNAHSTHVLQSLWRGLISGSELRRKHQMRSSQNSLKAKFAEFPFHALR